jgi:hypothetical protein
MASTPLKLYVLDREGFDCTQQLLLYTCKESAIDAMLMFSIRTKCIALLHVFKNQEDPTHPLELIETIRLKPTEDARSYRLWRKQEELGFTDKEAFNNLSMFYETIETITTVLIVD